MPWKSKTKWSRNNNMDLNVTNMIVQFILLGISLVLTFIALVMVHLGKGEDIRDKLYFGAVGSLGLFFVLPYIFGIFF